MITSTHSLTQTVRIPLTPYNLTPIPSHRQPHHLGTVPYHHGPCHMGDGPYREVLSALYRPCPHLSSILIVSSAYYKHPYLSASLESAADQSVGDCGLTSTLGSVISAACLSLKYAVDATLS